MYGLLRTSRFAAAFTLFALIATPSTAAASRTGVAAPVAGSASVASMGTASPTPAPVTPAATTPSPMRAPLMPAAATPSPASAPVMPGSETPAAAAGAAGQVQQVWTTNPFAAQPAKPYPLPAPRPGLAELVLSFVNYRNQDAQQLCLAKAVYFEARGETLEGQLAVAEVVLNRAQSGRYPATICEVVTQPWQFSFIRRGRFPAVNESSAAWHRALAIADVARKGLARKVAPNVLWYHATYVSPSWGRRLTRVAQIGAHIFYS